MLTPLERRVLRCYTVPARDIARVERISVNQVMEIKASLRARGIAPRAVELEEADRDGQMSFGLVDRLMRENRAPQPSDSEIGWTTSTDPEGW